MAGDWIKWQKRTWQKPEVMRTATILNISIGDAALAWIRLWEWADEISEDGGILGVAKGDIDCVVGVAGFADAAVTVGWLVLDDEGVSIPNFDRLNGKSAKRRTMEAARKKSTRCPH